MLFPLVYKLIIYNSYLERVAHRAVVTTLVTEVGEWHDCPYCWPGSFPSRLRYSHTCVSSSSSQESIALHESFVTRDFPGSSPPTFILCDIMKSVLISKALPLWTNGEIFYLARIKIIREHPSSELSGKLLQSSLS